MPIDVSVAELRDHPQRYDGQRVRFRDVVHHGFEGMSAAGAWWTPVGGAALEDGFHLADVEGDWHCHTTDGRGHGHMGMWPAEVRGAARLVPFDAPRVVEAATLRAAEERTPLEVVGTAQALLQGLFLEGLELVRLGPGGWLRRVERPVSLDVCVHGCRDGGRFYVHALRQTAERAIVPMLVAPDALGALGRGAYVEVTGLLAPGAVSSMPSPPGWPALLAWPRLEGVLDVVIPEVAHQPERHAVPNVRTPGMAAWSEILALGPRRVRAVGEIYETTRGPQLWATTLEPC